MNSADFTSYKFSATQESWNELLSLLPSESISSYKLSEIHNGQMRVGLELCSCSKKLLQLYMMQIIGGLTMLQTLQIVPFKDMVSLN